MAAVDAHLHVIDPGRFPLPGAAGYRPRADETATVEEIVACLDAHGLSHGLLVQPSGYGYDNRALLHALEAHPGRFRGVAVVDPGHPPGDLTQFAEAGVVGLRLNLIDFEPDALDAPDLVHLTDYVRRLGWFLEIHARARDFPQLAPRLTALELPLVIDHMGRPDPGSGTGEPGFQALLELAREPQVTLKLSAAFRFSKEAAPFADAAPFVEALMARAGPERLVWGSDWPCLQMAERPAYATLLEALEHWVPDAALRERILWHNPAERLGFL